MVRIGNVHLATNLLLSPIAGYCDLAFRLTIRPLGGVGLACTALVNPRGLLRETRRSMELVQTEPADCPLSIQLYGHRGDEMAEAARRCQELGAAILDVNLGCPADKVCKRRGGAALLREPRAAVRLVEQVVQAVNIPVTAKIRLGWDDSTIIAPELAAALEDVGTAAVTVHGRTAAQGFRGLVRLEEIARVVEAVRAIPVIGNGDVRSPADARRMIDRTGCAGVMIGRAALSDPWIFRDTHAYLTTGRIPLPPTPRGRVALISRHFEHLRRTRGERSACITFRQRVTWYARKLPPCREFCRRVRRLATAREFRELIEAFPYPEDAGADAAPPRESSARCSPA